MGLLRWGCRGGVCDLAYSSFVKKTHTICVYMIYTYIYIYIHMYIHTSGQFFDFWFRKSDCRRCDCRVGSSLGMHFPPHAAWGDLLMAVCWKWQHSKFQWVSRVIFQWASILDWKFMKPLQFGQNPFVFPTLAVLNHWTLHHLRGKAAVDHFRIREALKSLGWPAQSSHG